MAEAKVKAIKVDVLSSAGEVSGTIELNPEVFGVAFRDQVVFDAVQVYLANRRQATSKTKTRGEVSGGGKKPYRQKGTGRARAGSSRSPLWVGGGTVFGPSGEQNHKLSQNKKEHKLALKSVLSDKVANNHLIVTETIKIEAPKTKDAVKLLNAVKAEGKILLVVTEFDYATISSFLNIEKVIPVEVDNVSVYDVMHSDVVVIEKDALTSLQEVLS